jgi:hypothetical protein
MGDLPGVDKIAPARPAAGFALHKPDPWRHCANLSA